jgi:mRNA interferase HigB
MSRDPFKAWVTKLNQSDWNKPGDILVSFPTADLLGNGTDRVIFDIGGNLYRMICRYGFRGGEVNSILMETFTV